MDETSTQQWKLCVAGKTHNRQTACLDSRLQLREVTVSILASMAHTRLQFCCHVPCATNYPKTQDAEHASYEHAACVACFKTCMQVLHRKL